MTQSQITPELFAHSTYPDGCWATYISAIDGEEVRVGYHHKGGKSYGYFEQPFSKFVLWIYPSPDYHEEKDKEYKEVMLPKFQAWLDSIGVERS